MRNKNRSPKKRQGHQGIVQAPKALSGKMRFGAPDGTRPEGSENYNGHTPIEWPGLEAVAQYLAAPKSLREFKSDNDLAKHFLVTRMTIHRWKLHPDVIKRAHWLSNRYRLAGDLLVRINWPQIMQKASEKAMKGDMQAIKSCEEIAWRQEKQSEKSQISPYSLEEVLERSRIQYIKYGELMTPTWLKERTKRLAGEKPPVEAAGPPPAILDVQQIKAETEPQPAPKPESAHVNSCDACGKTRCVHGRCPACDICEVCQQPELGQTSP